MFYHVSRLLRVLLASEMLPYECLCGLFSSCSCIRANRKYLTSSFWWEVVVWIECLLVGVSECNASWLDFKCRSQAGSLSRDPLEILLEFVWWREPLDSVFKTNRKHTETEEPFFGFNSWHFTEGNTELERLWFPWAHSVNSVIRLHLQVGSCSLYWSY